VPRFRVSPLAIDLYSQLTLDAGAAVMLSRTALAAARARFEKEFRDGWGFEPHARQTSIYITYLRKNTRSELFAPALASIHTEHALPEQRNRIPAGGAWKSSLRQPGMYPAQKMAKMDGVYVGTRGAGEQGWLSRSVKQRIYNPSHQPLQSSEGGRCRLDYYHTRNVWVQTLRADTPCNHQKAVRHID